MHLLVLICALVVLGIAYAASKVFAPEKSKAYKDLVLENERLREVITKLKKETKDED